MNRNYQINSFDLLARSAFLEEGVFVEVVTLIDNHVTVLGLVLF